MWHNDTILSHHLKSWFHNDAINQRNAILKVKKMEGKEKNKDKEDAGKKKRRNIYIYFFFQRAPSNLQITAMNEFHGIISNQRGPLHCNLVVKINRVTIVLVRYRWTSLGKKGHICHKYRKMFRLIYDWYRNIEKKNRRMEMSRDHLYTWINR